MQTPFDLATQQWIFAALSAACVGISKSGFGAMAIPGILLMTQVMPARESSGVILPMLILADIFAVQSFRKFTVWRLLIKILPAAVLGVILGWAIMPRIPTGFFTPVIGWIILALLTLTIAQKCSNRLQEIAADHAAVAWPLGLLAGVSTMLANAAGPAMTVYLLASRLPKYEFVGTAAWFFFFINIIKVPFSASFLRKIPLGQNQSKRLRVAFNRSLLAWRVAIDLGLKIAHASARRIDGKPHSHMLLT
ncbi:MAG: sulfite exporter TauE/SafE family protein [Proteobacteria bacterium]|nr:sulfite exporter TauE/SafE family protein [Pseudomonadota bacterium]